MPRPGIDDVFGAEPSAPGLINTKSHVLKAGRRVGIGRNRDLQTHLLGHAAMHITEIEPIGLRVQLQVTAPLPDAPDPNAPKMVWVHWVLYNLPADCRGLPENVTTKGLPDGTLEGLNDWKASGWRGPCPPIGRHRYYIRLYALDCSLPDRDPMSRAELDRMMEGHILAEATLMGTYQKKH